MSRHPGDEYTDARYTGPLDASHATLAVVTLPLPGEGRVWKLLRVVAKSDAAANAVTIKTGTSIAGVAQKGPTIPIGVEAIIQALTDYLCTSPGAGQLDNQAVTVSVTGTAACRVSLEAVSIPTPKLDTTSGIAVTSA